MTLHAGDRHLRGPGGLRHHIAKRKARRLAAAVVAVAVAGAAAATGVLLSGATSAAPAGAAPAARRASAAFFARYVESDGRVVRVDQGGDTVSEGQAYAMLLAVATNDPARFESVWSWTSKHLLLPDGLLAYHWGRGKILSTSPAADADLDTAWALALAANRFRHPAYALAAKSMSAAILAHESVTLGAHVVLVAGPWATSTPAVIDPSYFSPEAFSALAQLSAKAKWRSVAASSKTIVGRLTSKPRRLPPNWATLSRSLGPTGITAPGQTGSPAYGLDAARTEVWSAASCRSATRSESASAWPLLRATASRARFPISMTTAGRAASAAVNPLIAVADAASAGAAGHPGEGRRLLADAATLNRRYPTYYGSAWLALGRTLLETSALGNCPVLAG